MELYKLQATAEIRVRITLIKTDGTNAVGATGLSTILKNPAGVTKIGTTDYTEATITEIEDAGSTDTGIYECYFPTTAPTKAFVDADEANPYTLILDSTDADIHYTPKDLRIVSVMPWEIAINSTVAKEVTVSGLNNFDPANDTVANVTTVDTTTTNTDMRGTDSAALASIATEARLSELDPTNIPSDIYSVLTTVSGLHNFNHLTETVTVSGGTVTLSEIEASTILAKEATLSSIDLELDGLAQEVTVQALPTLSGIEASSILAKDDTSQTILTETQSHPTLAEIEATNILAKETTVSGISSTVSGLHNFNHLTETVTVSGGTVTLSEIEASTILAKEATLDAIMGGGFTGETLEELMVAIKTRLASRSYNVVGAAPSSVVVTDGTILEGDYLTMATIDQTYLKIQETGNFKVDATFTNVDQVYDKFTFAGKYLGSAGHKVDLYMYNYNTTNWDDILATSRDIPNTSEDIIIEFNVPGTPSDYFDGSGPYTAQIRIEHEPSFFSSHEIWIDALCFGEVERIYVPADNITIQDTNIQLYDNTYGLSALKDSSINESQRLLSTIESQRGSHTATGNIFYWDPENGLDSNDGLTPATAKLTYDHADALGGIHGLLTDSNHDLIIFIPGNLTGATEVDEYIEIDTRYTFLRGPGRDAFINFSGAATKTCAIRLSAEGTELSGMRVNTSAGNDDAICVTGDFASIHDIWVDASRGHGIFIDNADHCMLSEFVIEDAASGGSGDAISIDGSGTGARRNFIFDGRIVNNNGDGVSIKGVNSSNNMMFGKIFIHDNTGFGINEAASSNDTIVVGPSITVAHNNSDGVQVQLLGTDSIALNLNQYAEEATLANVQVISQKSADAAFGTYELDELNNQLVLKNESLVEVARWDLTPDYLNPSGKTRV